jgi:hypothetical protein
LTAKDKHTAWAASVKNSLELDLKIKHGRGDSLLINDIPVFPPRFGRVATPIKAIQVADNDNKLRSSVQVTGYTFTYSPAVTVDEDGLELIPITFKIFSVERQDISLAEVNIMLLKDTKGSLYIGSVSKAMASGSGRVVDPATCRKWPSLCKIKSMSMAKFNELKAAFGCHGPSSRPQHGRPHLSRPHVVGQHRPHLTRPQHTGQHRHHRQRGPLFHGFVGIFVLPILLGLAAGFLTYAVIMFFGLLISYIYAAIRGAPRNGYVVLVEDEEQAAIKETEAHADAELPADAPPSYQDIPEKQ